MADIQFTGNLGGDVELRFTSSGKAVANFNVADSLRRKNPNTNEWEDVSTTWWRVQAWERLAETLAESLSKGTRVIVTGTVHARDWEDKDGQKRTAYDVTAKNVGIIPRSSASASRPQQSQQAAGDPWAAPVPTDEPPF